MKLYCWNVNGIRAVVKKGTFQKFIAEHKPDILCLQETKAEKGQAEIDLRFDRLLRMGDRLQTYKYAVKNVAYQAGKSATFMPKPLFE